MDNKIKYILQWADNSLILGQRIAEWTGHGPVLEQDMALTNIALDLIGEARYLYQYAAELEGNGKTEDDYPYKRDVREWRNLLLTELPNGDFGNTLMRQFMFDCFHFEFLQAMTQSKDERLAGIAHKSLKEASYHLRFSSEWVIRLGDGTDLSQRKMQKALNSLIIYFDECFMPSEIDTKAIHQGYGIDPSTLKGSATKKLKVTIETATLSLPENVIPQKGGRKGLHTEYLGHLLSDLQFLQRAYPDLQW